MKDVIYIDDFIKEVILDLEWEDCDKFLDKLTTYHYICPKCNHNYNNSDKFCSKDGSEIIQRPVEVRHSKYDDFCMRTIMDLESCEFTDKFPYTIIDNVEKRGDGSGYYYNYIIQRKSDDKFFYISIHAGDYRTSMDGDYFEETTKVVKTSWDFERFFD